MAGMLKTSAETKGLEFSLPEPLSIRKIKNHSTFHAVAIELKNHDVMIGCNLLTSLQPDVSWLANCPDHLTSSEQNSLLKLLKPNPKDPKPASKTRRFQTRNSTQSKDGTLPR
jgi:hypothetical protein